MVPELPEPDFSSCDEEWHENCECRAVLNEWLKFVESNAQKIDNLIVHAAFQIIFLDRRFLHDFNLELAEFIEDYIDDIKELRNEYVTAKNRIKRSSFPKWLTNAVFYRDKGTC